MARERGKQGTGRRRVDPPAESRARDEALASLVPDLLRRMLGIGLSGFFLTEEAVRKALGDTVPKDWVDYVSETSERTRAEFVERLAREVGETLERVDLAALAEQLLASHSVEVKAEIRLVPHRGEDGGQPIRIRFARRGRRR